MVLKQSSGFALSTQFVYPRLLLAIDCHQVSFVAHSNVQQVFFSFNFKKNKINFKLFFFCLLQVIERKWMDDWYEWKFMSTLHRVLIILPRIIALPILIVFVLLLPNSSKSRHWKIPANKFLSYVASYFVFLACVFVQSNMDKTEQPRGPPNSGNNF